MLILTYEGITFGDFILNIPGSLFFILMLATSTAFISAGLTKYLVDTAEIERKQRQIKVHREEKEKIIDLAETDVNKYRKERKRWERKDGMMKKTEQRMSLQRMKPTCVTFIPLLVILGVFGVFYGSGSISVAISPMNPSKIPLLGNMIAPGDMGPYINFTAWYMLSSFTMNSLIQRALGIMTQTTGGGMSQMFSSQKVKALEFPDA